MILSLRNSVLWSLASVFLYLGLEAAIFRSGWYSAYLEPNSTAGEVEYHLLWLKHAAPAKAPEVVVVGDSQVAEGFSPPLAAAQVGGRLHFTSFGVPGSTPRVWYYMLRDADPQRSRFSAIVIEFDQYSDQDWGEDARDRVADVNYLAGRLEIDDCFDFAQSYANRKLRPQILTECFFKGTAYRGDVQDFLRDIPDRIARAREWGEKGGGYIEGYTGKPEELTGLTVDAEKREIHFPPNLKDWQMDNVANSVFPNYVLQTGALTRYRREWVGSILELYKGSSTRVVFVQPPRAPWSRPEPPTPARFVDSARANHAVTVIPADTFKDLERAELFSDGQHLNSVGRAIFSKRLADKVAEALGVR